MVWYEKDKRDIIQHKIFKKQLQLFKFLLSALLQDIILSIKIAHALIKTDLQTHISSKSCRDQSDLEIKAIIAAPIIYYCLSTESACIL